jgi:hypothetical protein
MEVKTWSINLVVYELSSARPDFDVLSASFENKIGASAGGGHTSPLKV